jgi:subtilisin family serine protease
MATAAAVTVELLGGRVSATRRDLVFATVAISRLPLLAGDDAVLRVRTPFRSRPDATSEGVAAHQADVLHGQGVTGAGSKVGVLDCGGFSGYQALLGTELPAQVTVWNDTPGSGDHGTACAELIHDMAPDAQLYFAHDDNEADFYAAVDWLVAQQVDVISYSCAWLGEYPGDGDGDPHNPVNQKVMDARAAGVLFVTSSGNYAGGENYQGWYEPHDGSNWHSFDGDSSNLIWLWDGSEHYFTLTWNDWPADPLTQGSSQDYQLDLWRFEDPDWVAVASSENPQDGTPGQTPFEEISIWVPTGAWHTVIIRAESTTQPHFLSLRTFRASFTHFNPEYSCYTPETPAALTVGAAFWNGLGLEPFSSQGPIFGPGGTPDGGSLAPRITGADGVTTSTYGPSDGVPWSSGGTGFWGTSAACPHVAGGAALVLAEHPAATVDDAEALLLGSAQDLGPAGPDTQFGYGWMDLSGWLFADGFESGDCTAWSSVVP